MSGNECVTAYDDALWRLIQEGDFITSDGYLAWASTRDDVLYWKRDLILRGGAWRGVSYPALVTARRPPRVETVIVGHGDLTLGASVQRLLRLRGYRNVCGINVEARPGLSFGLPLGLTNDCDDSPLHRVLGNQRHIAEAFATTPRLEQPTGTVLACFSVHTAPRFRAPLADLIKHERDFIWVEPELTDIGRISFLRQLRTSDFVLCPRGNGIDTHRLWETLYMGGIPVVRRSDCWPSLLEGLPVLMLDDWSELLDAEAREMAWSRIRQGVWSAAALRQSTWNTRIEASIDPI